MPMVTRPVSSRSPHSIAGIGPVKEDDILQHANDNGAVGNIEQDHRSIKQRDSPRSGFGNFMSATHSRRVFDAKIFSHIVQ
jgi:transposase-like protein